MLSAEALSRACGRPVRFFERCGSTNVEALALADAGAPSGTLVVAELQEAGRGRQGRSWQSPPGDNLYLSLILRPALPLSKAPLVCLAAAVGLAEALELGVKWPNDLLDAHGRKVAGVLAQVRSEGERLDAVVLGIGVNVNQTHFPPELPDAGSLALLRGPQDRLAVLARVLARVEGWVAQLEVAPGAVLDAWRAHSVTLGRRVRVGELEGEAVALRDDGALLIETPEGLRAVLAGDVEMVG